MMWLVSLCPCFLLALAAALPGRALTAQRTKLLAALPLTSLGILVALFVGDDPYRPGTSTYWETRASFEGAVIFAATATALTATAAVVAWAVLRSRTLVARVACLVGAASGVALIAFTAVAFIPD